MASSTDMQAPQEVTIRSGRVSLKGHLGIPVSPLGMVVFAHGSGSGRFSPRNNFVARFLQQGRVATLLIDLLTPDEAEDRRKVFDIDLLADRVLLAKAGLEQDDRAQGLGIGYFGASTGAGAALQAAARDPSSIQAIVSRGGRPDLADRPLPDRVAGRQTGSGRGLSAIGYRADHADCRWRRRTGHRDESSSLPTAFLP